MRHIFSIADWVLSCVDVDLLWETAGRNQRSTVGSVVVSQSCDSVMRTLIMTRCVLLAQRMDISILAQENQCMTILDDPAALRELNSRVTEIDVSVNDSTEQECSVDKNHTDRAPCSRYGKTEYDDKRRHEIQE